jgi:hypothetical protein
VWIRGEFAAPGKAPDTMKTSTDTSSPAPFAVRSCVPLYDGRDGHCGTSRSFEPYRYGTLAGASFRAGRLNDDSCNNGGEVFYDIVDTRTGREVLPTQRRRVVEVVEDDGLPF